MDTGGYSDSEDEKQRVPVKKSFSADGPWTYDEQEESSEEDSDAEFLVHPCLRSLIKSKSAYSVPREKIESNMKPSKTTFEINLSRMLNSTTKSIVMDSETSMADFIPCLDTKWPEPDDSEEEKEQKRRKKRGKKMERYSASESEPELGGLDDFLPTKPRKRCSGCWSSPPEVLQDRSFSTSPQLQGREECWSAPELVDDEPPSPEEEFGCKDVPTTWILPPKVVQLREPPYSTSYPVIDTPDPDLSICSYRLPSSLGSAPSLSPPRPLSPVFGRPAKISSKISSSQSMQLPPKPDLSSFMDQPGEILVLASDDGSTSDADEEVWPQRDPWPHQEVWPEFAMARECWTDASGGLHRSATFHPVGQRVAVSAQSEPRGFGTIPTSRSAHSHLYDWGTEEDILDDFGRRQPPGDVEDDDDFSGSALDDFESKALATRQEWMEHGSIACLGLTPEYSEALFAAARNRYHPEVFDVVHCNGVQSQYGSFSSLAGAPSPSPSQAMRRSCTTEEFRVKGRRRLPRRPDELCAPIDLPQSKSMYERALREQFLATVERPSDEADGNQDSFEEKTPGARLDLRRRTAAHERRDRRPPSLDLQKTVNTLIESKNSSTMPQRAGYDPFSNLETPISPRVLPSPGSGRRLPPLPIHSTSLLQHLPAAMSLPPKSSDHTLCFMDGMGDSMMERSTALGLEDSYYEEDSINGNRRKQRHTNRKSFFSPDDSSGVSSCTTSDSVNPTHRVQSAFHPRHNDEVLLEIGDALHVDRSSDDHWSYGTNLRTGQSGIFPTAVVCEIDIVEEICLGALPTNATKIMTEERDTFFLTLLASIEVAHHKGNDVLVQAMNKVLSMYKNADEIIVPQTVLLEISFRGIHVIDKRRKNLFQCPTFDFFYSLQNISFCGAHPKQLKYFGFITKAPASTEICLSLESIGRAFKRSYDEYMAFAHPTEDIYLE
ncbi:unnamed protein product [Caenorhabditis auriculariae]|uniref:SH3 domain-containing protein n=1 Tax=Caenorhabditis auriculariae TaxID=2777116 RepID=A0A8S1HLS5_9PELO|nr:unnamed protein product [Caenorhabditis auriculariae]